MTTDRVLEMRFDSDPQRLKAVRSRVRDAAECLGCGDKVVSELVLAVNEACMNIMQHAYKGDSSGEIVLEILNNGDELELCLKDFAEPVDPERIRPRELDALRPGGLGTHFISEVMDEYVYGHLEGRTGNYLRMRKKIG